MLIVTNNGTTTIEASGATGGVGRARKPVVLNRTVDTRPIDTSAEGRRLRFHVVALPNTPTNKAACWCAFQSKVLKFCKMMRRLGHWVAHYGVPGSEVDADISRDFFTQAEYQNFFGHHDPRKTPSPIVFDKGEPYFMLASERTVDLIRPLMQPGDFLCLISECQRLIADRLPELTCVEYGIGYSGVFAPYRVYESYGHQAFMWGHDGWDPDGRPQDAVIPNYFDADDFTFEPNPSGCVDRVGDEPTPYALFMARMVRRKGIEMAVEATRRTGWRLLLCGQGATWDERVHTLTYEAGRTVSGEHLRYVGTADIQRRNELMRNASCLILPTMYLEPFGGVNAEAQMCGTPVVSSDWGAFPETVEQGKTGYRCRTVEEFSEALRNVNRLDRQYVAERARRLYSLEAVGKMFEGYFTRIAAEKVRR